MADAGAVTIPLTTVSLNRNFDAYLDVSFASGAPGATVQTVVDSGNSMLIVPDWEDIASLSNWNTNYTILGSGQEPWGCPAKIVRGPIHVATSGGGAYVIGGRVFYACTGLSPEGERTANFGAGGISPWLASGWNVPPGAGVTTQAPLSYNPAYPYAEFSFASAADIHGSGVTPKVAGGSYLTLYKALPAGYRLFSILPDTEWMSLIPLALTIGTDKTRWPGAVTSPIAMVDTGGGPVFLSDPNQYACKSAWPNPAANPAWASTSDTCESTSNAITVSLGDGAGAFSYTIDPNQFPLPSRGLTLVMCKRNDYMRGQEGMNIGGISALVNQILVDYAHARVEFKPK